MPGVVNPKRSAGRRHHTAFGPCMRWSGIGNVTRRCPSGSASQPRVARPISVSAAHGDHPQSEAGAVGEYSGPGVLSIDQLVHGRPSVGDVAERTSERGEINLAAAHLGVRESPRHESLMCTRLTRPAAADASATGSTPAKKTFAQSSVSPSAPMPDPSMNDTTSPVVCRKPNGTGSRANSTPSGSRNGEQALELCPQQLLRLPLRHRDEQVPAARDHDNVDGPDLGGELDRAAILEVGEL